MMSLLSSSICAVLVMFMNLRGAGDMLEVFILELLGILKMGKW
jgi:hypothetical protein